MADIDNIAVPSLFDTIYGSFNGGGHTLSFNIPPSVSLTMSSPFGTLVPTNSTKPILDSLKIKSNVKSTDAGFSNLAIENTDDVGTISNLVNMIDVQTDVWNKGIAGINSNNTEIKISNCINHANIDGMIFIGGISAINDKEIIITNCINTGNITGITVVGGIFGAIANSSFVVSSCINTGKISGTSNIGGIIAYITFEKKTFDLENNSNYGKITINNGSICGGIVGSLGTSYTPLSYHQNFSNCISTGSIEANNDSHCVLGAIYRSIFSIINCYWDKQMCPDD